MRTEKMKLYQHNYYLKNKEKIKKNYKKWCKTHKKQVKKYHRDYYHKKLKNTEKTKEMIKKNSDKLNNYRKVGRYIMKNYSELYDIIKEKLGVVC